MSKDIEYEDDEFAIKNSRFGKSVKLFVIGLILGVILSGIIVWKWTSTSRNKEIMNIQSFYDNKEIQDITIEYISKKLENISELATAEMIYNGLFTTTEGNIPIVTKKGFSMIYTASVKAGIDPSLIKTEISDKKVIITIPASEIQMPKVDPDSIQFYDEKHAIFNWNKKTDVTSAISAAERNVKTKADIDGLLKRASQQAEFIIRGILEGSTGKREIVVIHGNAQ